MAGELHRLLAEVSRANCRRSFAQFSQCGITQGQPRILNFLSQHDGCIQRDLGDQCRLEPATVTNILSGMEKAGFVERRTEPGDRRVLRVFLTSKGRAAQRQVERVNIALEEECFTGFTDEEKSRAADMLRRMVDNLDRAEGKNGKCG